MRLAREQPRPQGPAHLADIKIAAGIDRQTMRPDERGRRRAGKRVADARQQLALIVDNANPWPEIGVEAVDRKLADIADRAMSVRHEEPAWAVQIVPLSLVFAVAVEYLDPVIFAVGDVDPAVGVGADVVDEVEL